MKNTPLILSIVVFIVGILSFIGWFYTIPYLTHFSLSYLPIAVLTSMLLVFTSIFYGCYFLPIKNKTLTAFANSIAFFTLCIAIFNGIDFLWIPGWSLENTFIHFISNITTVENTVHISPIATVVFICASSLFLIQQQNINNLVVNVFIKGCFYVQFLISSFFILVYVENISVFYLNNIYSLALPTAIALFILSNIQLYFINFQVWPFHFLQSGTLQSKLIKYFLPLLIVLLILVNVLEHYLPLYHNFSYLSALLFIVLIALIILSYQIVSKKVGNELHETKSLYQSLFDSSMVGLYQTTPKGKIVSANPTIIRMLEFDSLEELMKRDLSKGSYVNPTKRTEFKQHIETYGEINNFESEWYTKNGNIITVEESAKAIKNEAGKIIRYDGVVQNISDHKVAINKLKVNEAQLNAILDNNSIGIWNFNFKNQSSNRSEHHDKLFGYETPKKEWTYETYMSHVYKDDFDYVKQCYLNALNNGQPFNFDCRIVRTDNQVRWVKVTGKHVADKSGAIVGLSGMVQDITENKLIDIQIKEAKNELEDVFKNDISANFTTTTNGNIINCNRTFLKLFGFESLEEVQQTNIKDFYSDATKRTILLRSLLLNKKILNEEVVFITKKGEKINCLINLVGIFDTNNKLIKTRGYIVNITNLKNTEIQLKQSEERFRLASKATNEVIWERDLVHQTLWRSENFETVFGWKLDEFGYTDDDIKRRMHPDDLQRVSDKIYAFFASDDEFWEDSYRMQTKDGSYAYVYDRAYKFKDKNNKPIKVLGSMANKTQEVWRKQQMAESEEKYKNILENALIGVYETDFNGNILFANQYIKDQSGYNLGNEIEQVNILDLYVHPELRTKLFNELQSNGFVRNFEVAFYTKTKQIKYCLMNAKLFEHKIVGMLLDITNIKLNEFELSKLSKAIHQSPVSVVITDKNGIIEYANPKVIETTGYTYNELIGNNPRILKSGDKTPETYQHMWNTLVSGNDWVGEFHNKKKNGELFWEKASISPVFDAEKNITHFIAIKEDITKQKEILQELTIAKDKAEESDRLKSAFLANMSHEIRTPMNGILGFSELLKTPNLSVEKQKKYIEIIEKSGARMLTTINDIIDISKIESQLVTVTYKEVNITKQLHEIYAFFLPEASKKGIQFIYNNNNHTTDLIVTSDADKIYAILQNLVKNAVKFTHNGTIEMGYHLQNNNLNVYVSDTGIGIPTARQAHVFDRFVQADIEDKSVYEGSGLGLTISKSYAMMLGGDIYLKSTEGQGATFTFTLPIQNNTITIKSEQNNLNINNHPTPLTNNQLNVLIVDDETTVQLYLQEILFKNTHQLFVASNGIEALEILKNNPSINLVLLDIQMPKMNGFDVAMHIRTFNKKVVIIAQTALTQPADKEKALAIGCNDYISKPINKDELFLKIETLFKTN